MIQEMQWWDIERIRAWQWDRIQSLLRFAFEHVPFYRRLFQSLGATPDDFRCWEDFERLPILSKEEIQEHWQALRAHSVLAVENHTGGSTGQPLHFYQDMNYKEWAALSRRWGAALCGFRGGEKQLFLWGSDYDSKAHESWRGRLRDWIRNVRWINAFDLSALQLKQIAFEVAQWQPDFIWGYASTLELLADQLRREGLEIHPKSVQSTAGTLYPSLRRKLEEVFGPVVFDRYGSREVSIIAHECDAHQGLHVFCPHNYVEILEEAKGWGQVIVTNLHNRAFPFIRYDIGDLAVWADHPCSCGRGFPLIRRIIGRTVEVVRSPGGKLLDGEFFTHLFYRVKGVRQFQVVQETPKQLVIKIIPGEGYRSDVLAFLTTKILKYGDPAFEIRFELVDRIPPLRSGKRAFVISKVSKGQP